VSKLLLIHPQQIPSPINVISVKKKKMKYLHVAVMEDLEECLVSFTEEGLREQVNEMLVKNSIAAPSDDEWADCVKGEETKCDVAPDCLPFGVILYYKTESKLAEMAAVNGSH
jgi:hypothetical protein